VILLRKPFLFLLALATGASLLGGGRLSLRLLLDTSVALAIIPVIQVMAFAVVYWSGHRRLGFSRAVDAFFSASGPWFGAIAVVAAFGAFASPIAAAQWFTRISTTAFIAAIVVTSRLDFTFFRDVLGRTPRRAAVDLVVQRAIGWSATIGYFIASSAPKLGWLIPDIAANLFGAHP
jgi:hypothetical protein